MHRPTLLTTLATAVLVIPQGVLAQDAWHWDVELGGSLFFGEVDQTAFMAAGGVEKADSSYELSASVRFDYGETGDPDTGASVVSRRSWLGDASVDWTPADRWSPFAFGTGERSFEKRIDFRYNAGIGLKQTLVRDDRSRIDLSGGFLGEQTFAEEPVSGGPPSDLLARFSLRFRLRHAFGDGRLTFDTRSTYAPEVGRASNTNFRSLSSLDYRLTSVLSFGIDFDYSYESLAISRGARSNDTGRLNLTLKGTF